MALPTLTTEIISMVLNEIPLTDKPTLAACCLISKPLHRSARAKLYTTLSFAIAEDAEATATDPDMYTALTPSAFHLWRTLHFCPEFGRHVREASIDEGSYRRPSWRGAVVAAILDMLRGRCPSLEHLCFVNSTADDEKSDTALAKFGTQLRSLDFVPGRFLGSGGLRMLRKLSGLTTLDGIDSADFHSSLPNLVLRPKFEITSSEPANIDEGFLHYIYHHSHESLLSLSLLSVDSRAKPWDLSAFVALRSLTLYIVNGRPICSDDGQKGIDSSIKTCRNLTYLKLWGDESGEEPDDEEPFLHHLPPTLTTLVLDEIWAPYADLIEDLSDTTVLPSLLHLVLSDVTQPEEESSEEEEKGELVWKSACDKIESRMKEIESLCEGRSIEVKWES